jgi:DNA-binding transcriptional LysR family regulator
VRAELRQIHYFVAVAEELNFTRAAERLHMAQPPLSAAIRQLEEQLGVELLRRTTRQVELTPAGRLLLEQGRELLGHADAVLAAVRETERAPVGRLSVGVAPPARFGVAPELLGACATRVSGVMLYPREDTTGTLIHDLRAGRLDLAIGFCAPAGDLGLERERLRDEPAVLHVRADHPLAQRSGVTFAELSTETFLVAGGRGSPGYTATVLDSCRSGGFEPAVVADPYPDLGLRAVHEGLGVAVYVRSAFAPHVDGSAFVPIEAVTLPFDLLWRPGVRSGALASVLGVARDLRDEREWTQAANAPTDS